MNKVASPLISWDMFPAFCMAFVAMYVLPGRLLPCKTDREAPFSGTVNDVSALRCLESRLREGDRSHRGTRPQPVSWRKLPACGGRTTIRPIARQEPAAAQQQTARATAAVPEIPVPLRSELIVFAGGLGDINASFSVYEGWGDLTSILGSLRGDFYEAGWRRNRRFEELAQPDLPGIVLSYTRGHERCLLSVERVRESGKIETLVLYVEKGWLPPNTGF